VPPVSPRRRGTAILAWILVASFGATVGASFGGLAPTRASAQSIRETAPLSDLLQIVVRKREILAIDATSGSQREVDLDRGERVMWHDTRGAVAVVLTDQRILAVATRSGSWQAERYRAGERHPPTGLLGDRVALIVTNKRAIGFDGGSGNLIDEDLGPRESVLQSRVAENVAVVVTDRRALGISPFVGGFFPVDLRLSERIEDLSAAANLVTLTTSHRLLTFRANTGTWEERQLDLR
jgi:hypothetical protein